MSDTIDTYKHELSWLLRDAVGLAHLGHRFSALLLLLCGIDAFAVRRYPRLGPGPRFKRFLKEQLPSHTHIENFWIRVPTTDKKLRVEEILYKYLRNPMVHEGAHLDVEKPKNFAVYLDWKEGAPTVKVDNDSNRVILSGMWVIEMLARVIIGAIRADLTKLREGRGIERRASQSNRLAS